MKRQLSDDGAQNVTRSQHLTGLVNKHCHLNSHKAHLSFTYTVGTLDNKSTVETRTHNGHYYTNGK